MKQIQVREGYNFPTNVFWPGAFDYFAGYIYITMTRHVCKDHAELSAKTAEMIVDHIVRKPEAVLCLAAGDTPRLTYEILVKKVRKEQLDVSHCTFIALDEWVGIPPDNPGSCAYFLAKNIFEPLAISPNQTFLFDALSDDPQRECRKMDDLIVSKGGIDLMLVGVGMNGHIGFNEPCVSRDLGAHVVPLDEITKSVGQKYFAEQTTLEYGITLGLKHFMESRNAMMMASGFKKAEVMKRALEEPVNSEVPASIIQNHASAVVMLDEEAASGIP